MSSALKFNGIDNYAQSTVPMVKPTGDAYLEVDVIFDSVNSGTTTYLCWIGGAAGSQRIYLSVNFNGNIGFAGRGSMLSSPSYQAVVGERHTLRIAYESGDWVGYFDAVEVGRYSNAMSDIQNGGVTLGANPSLSVGNDAFSIVTAKWVDINTPANNRTYDASASDRSNTGNQPVLVDIIGNNDATGVGFPEDGSVWYSTGVTSEIHSLSGAVTQTTGTTASYLKGAALSSNIGQSFALSGHYAKFAELDSSFIQTNLTNGALSKSTLLQNTIGQISQANSSYNKVIPLASLCSTPSQTNSSLVKIASLAAFLAQSFSANNYYTKLGLVSGSVLQPTTTYGSYFNEAHEVHSLANTLTQTVVTLSSFNKSVQLSSLVNQLYNESSEYSKGVNLTSTLTQAINDSSFYNKASMQAAELVVATQTTSLLHKLASVYGQLTQTFTTTGYLFNPDDIQVIQTYLRFDGQLIDVRFDGVINEYRQDGSLNTNTEVVLMLYESSYHQFKTAVLGYSAADFTNAKYQIFARLGGTALVTKALGDGIERTGSEFITTINATDITRPGTYHHQFIVYNQDNQPLPPVFAGEVKFNEVK